MKLFACGSAYLQLYAILAYVKLHIVHSDDSSYFGITHNLAHNQFIVQCSSMPKDVFDRFKQKLNICISSDIIKILRGTGYDSEFALECLDTENIREIEEFVNNERHILKDTVYENRLNFKFLPGHKALLLNLSNKVGELRDKPKSNSKSYAVETIYIDNNHENIENNSEIIQNIGTNYIDIQKVVEPIDIRPISIEERSNELKNKLIDKLTKYSSKNKVDIRLEGKHILNYRNTINGVIKCDIECPSCLKKIPCIFKKYWLVSNIEKHFHTHVKQADNRNKQPEESEQLASATNSFGRTVDSSVDLCGEYQMLRDANTSADTSNHRNSKSTQFNQNLLDGLNALLN